MTYDQSLGAVSLILLLAVHMQYGGSDSFENYGSQAAHTAN